MKLPVLPLLLAASCARAEDTQDVYQGRADDALRLAARYPVADRNIWERHPEPPLYHHNIALRVASSNPDSILSFDVRGPAPAKKAPPSPQKAPSKKAPAAKNTPAAKKTPVAAKKNTPAKKKEASAAKNTPAGKKTPAGKQTPKAAIPKKGAASKKPPATNKGPAKAAKNKSSGKKEANVPKKGGKSGAAPKNASKHPNKKTPAQGAAKAKESKAKTPSGKSALKGVQKSKSANTKAQKSNASKAKSQEGNASKGKAADGKTTPAKTAQKAKAPEGKKAALAKGNKSTNSPKGAEASCSEKRGLGSVGAACKTKFGKASSRKGKNTKDAQDPNVRKDAGTQKLEELAKKKGIELEHDATYVIKEKTGGKIIPHEYVAGVKYQKTNNQGIEEHTATGKRYDLFVGGKKVNVKDRIQKNQDQVDATVNAKGSSKIPVMHSKHNAYIEEHAWYPNKKKGGSKLLGKMDSKFVGPDGPEGWEILKEGGKILTGDPYEQAGGKYSILAHCTKGGDANNCKTMAKKLGNTIVEKPREVSY